MFSRRGHKVKEANLKMDVQDTKVDSYQESKGVERRGEPF